MRLIALALALAAASGCTPIYTPGAANLAMLEDAGDLHIQGSVGTPGAQVDAAYAIAPSVALRATGELVGASATEVGEQPQFYRHAALGFGYFFAGEGGLRLSASAEAGPTASAGGYSIGSTVNYYTGRGIKASLPIDISYEHDNAAIGFVARPVMYAFTHRDGSDGAGTDTIGFTEATLVGRVGAPEVKVEAQLGLVLPIAVAADVDIGLPFPVVLGLGLVIDLETREKSEP